MGTSTQRAHETRDHAGATMRRVWIPCVVSDLAQPRCPVRSVVIPDFESVSNVDEGVDAALTSAAVALSADDIERGEYDALIDASIESLIVIRDSQEGTSPEVPRRVVAVADLDLNSEDVTRGHSALPRHVDWHHVRALFVDDDDGVDVVRACCEAATQDEADRCVEVLLDFPLDWYDIAEREALARTLLGVDSQG